MCLGDCIKKHIWKAIAFIAIALAITFAVLYGTYVSLCTRYIYSKNGLCPHGNSDFL
jgi:hypothetical protein